MPLAGKCIQECTTPQHGYVQDGRDVEFELPEWDLKKFPYLKHFKQKSKAKNPQPSIDEGVTAAALKAAKKTENALPLGVSPAPVTEETPDAVKKLAAMTPEELDDVKVDELLERGKAHDLDLDADSDRTDLIVSVMDAEEKATDLFE